MKIENFLLPLRGKKDNCMKDRHFILTILFALLLSCSGTNEKKESADADNTVSTFSSETGNNEDAVEGEEIGVMTVTNRLKLYRNL